MLNGFRGFYGFSQNNIVSQDLILYLDAANPESYSGSGSAWNDLSGNNFDGTLINGVGYDATDGGGSLTFNYTDQYVTTTGMENYSYVNGITVSVWHKNGGGTDAYRGFVTNGNVDARQGGFDLRYGREDYFGGANNGTNLGWRITDNSTTTQTAVNLYSNVNEWHNYVGTYNNGDIVVYKDGALFDSVTHPVGGQLRIMPASTTIGWSPGTSEYLDGKVGQVLIYDRPLSQKEIENNFNVFRDRFGL